MIGCLVIAFALCQAGYSGAYVQSGYAQQGYYGQGYAQPQVVYAQPQPVYVVQPQPVYVVPAAPVYYGGYAGNGPFAGNGIGVRVNSRGGVSVRCC